MVISFMSRVPYALEENVVSRTLTRDFRTRPQNPKSGTRSVSARLSR